MNLQELYDSIDYEKIQEFITERTQEDLHLDFKEVRSASMTSADDKKNYAKALSGFANSDGGIIVWGVQARKNDDNIDCATEEKPFENFEAFLSKLNSNEGEFVSPLVDGVSHKAFPDPKHPDKGFAVSFIPASLSAPHMAKGGEHRYYKRSGDSFYKMEHFDIVDVFTRKREPQLSITDISVIGHRMAPTKIEPVSGKIVEFQIQAELENMGLIWAEEVRLGIILFQSGSSAPKLSQYLSNQITTTKAEFSYPGNPSFLLPTYLLHSGMSGQKPFTLSPLDVKAVLFGGFAAITEFGYPLNYTWKAAIYVIAKNTALTWYQVDLKIDESIRKWPSKLDAADGGALEFRKLISEKPLVGWVKNL